MRCSKSILFGAIFFGFVLVDFVSAQEEQPLIYLVALQNRTITTPTAQEKLFAERFEETVLEVLKNEIDATDFRVVVLSPDGIPDEVPAVRIGGYYYIDGNWFTLTIQTTIANSGITINTDVIEGRIGVTVYTRLVEAVANVVPGIRGSITANITESDASRFITTNIRLVSPLEGSEIYYHADPETQLGVIEDGELNLAWLSFPAGEEITLEQRLEGHYIRPQSVVINNDAVITLAVPPRKHSFGVSTWWTIGQAQGAGAGFRWYIVPDTLFVGLDNYFYVQSYQEGVQTIFHNDLRAMVGLFVLFPPTSPFRIGLATGFGTVISDIFESTALDLYVSIIDVWAQIEITEWLVLFARSEIKWSLGNALGTNNNLLGSGRLNSGLGDLLEIDFLSVAALSIGTEIRF